MGGAAHIRMTMQFVGVVGGKVEANYYISKGETVVCGKVSLMFATLALSAVTCIVN